MLAGDRQVDGGCVWMEVEGGRQSIRCFAGCRAHFFDGASGPTFELLDGTGTVVAAEGDRVRYNGTPFPDGERCQVTDDVPVWIGPVSRAP